MRTLTKVALAAVLLIGSASAGLAEKDDNHTGGYRVGPLGQHFSGANPVYHRSWRRGLNAFAFEPAPAFGGDMTYCEQRFRTFDPITGTYMGFDGLRHPCP